MYSRCQPLCVGLPSNEVLHNPQFPIATWLKSAGIMEYVTVMVREDKFVLNFVIATLARVSSNRRQMVPYHKPLWSPRVESSRVVRPYWQIFTNVRPHTGSWLILADRLRITGLCVVSQTRCKIEVLPEFALPIIRTRNLMFGSWRPGFCCIVITRGRKSESKTGASCTRTPWLYDRKFSPHLLLSANGVEREVTSR